MGGKEGGKHMKISNPILRGFHPDPSLVKTDHGYYIATSTFEWFPGVRIYYSPDLLHWSLAAHALTNDQEIDLTGVDTACGIWAPNLTWDDGTFYLTTTIVYTNRSRFKDTYNFYMTAQNVRGPWSKPVFLNRSGFDPSIFHDDDGKKYFVNMTIDYHPDHTRFSGIDVQELDVENGRLIGQPRRIYTGSFRGTTEGPNIMKHNGYYYLVCAEGGTEFGHCAVMLRSKNLFGPYEDDPHNPIITSSGKNCLLQRAGHMQAVEAADGNWYIAHLCSRPVDGYSILGRETALQNVEWTEDGWLKLSGNDTAEPENEFELEPEKTRIGDCRSLPDSRQEAYMVSDSAETVKTITYSFADGRIPQDFLTLRNSFAANGISVCEEKLCIEGGCSPMSKFRQGLLARTQESFFCDFTAVMEFAPRHQNHLAGILVYYNYDNFYYLYETREQGGKKLFLMTNVNRELTVYDPAELEESVHSVSLTAEIRERSLQFGYQIPGGNLQKIGPKLDMRMISDEHVHGNGFTGSMLGVNCADLQGDGIQAKFSKLIYRECIQKNEE